MLSLIIGILLVVTLFGLCCDSRQHRLALSPEWLCVGCKDEKTKSKVFDIVRHAMRFESREVYLNFDHSWIDSALLPRASVKVTLIDFSTLGHSIVSNAEKGNDDIPKTLLEQKYDVIVSLPPQDTATTVTRQDIARNIDSFLQHNPCWMPLHDPNPQSLGPATRDAAAVQSRQQQRNDSSSANWRSTYDQSAILIRLPSNPFHTTCMLYEMIAKQQNPAKCPSMESAYLVYWLGNIGWSNCVHVLLYYFQSSLRNGRILLAPRAKENGFEKELKVAVNGKMVKVNGTWGAWADRDICPINTFAWDPWACHYISLSSCHSPEKQNLPYVDNADGMQEPVKKSTYMTSLVSSMICIKIISVPICSVCDIRLLLTSCYTLSVPGSWLLYVVAIMKSVALLF
jgi:hypothetical protein